MYEKFYDLTTRPFLTVPDADFLYWSEAHTLAFTMLQYSLSTRAQISVVTGEIGAGKTTLLRHLISQAPEDLTIGLVSNMQAGRGELLHWVMMALDQPICADESYVALFKRFQDYVIDVYAGGGRVVLVLDEAQNLSVAQLEELRMLSNINADKDELLQLILIGQPQLRTLLAHPDLTQFAQRITSDFHLTGLEAGEVEKYISHRLSLAGAKWRIFPTGTCALIHIATHGIPRLINVLCDLSLVYGFAAEKKVVDETLVREFLTAARRRNIYTQFSPLPPTPTLMRDAI